MKEPEIVYEEDSGNSRKSSMSESQLSSSMHPVNSQSPFYEETYYVTAFRENYLILIS